MAPQPLGVLAEVNQAGNFSSNVFLLRTVLMAFTKPKPWLYKAEHKASGISLPHHQGRIANAVHQARTKILYSAKTFHTTDSNIILLAQYSIVIRSLYHLKLVDASG
jgi:hypothetical protein